MIVTTNLVVLDKRVNTQPWAFLSKELIRTERSANETLSNLLANKVAKFKLLGVTLIIK